MKFKMVARGLVVTAFVSVAVAASAIAPVQAAAKSTVILHSAADITSLNSSTAEGNTAYNNVVSSLTGMGFTYYNEQTELVMNTAFGS
ncbi:MAG: hypothetical protein ACKO97_08290, partial [Actinomycetota bacterium]